MKNKEFVLRRCEEAVNSYFYALTDKERSNSIAQMEVLISILDPGEMPLRLTLKYHEACQDAMLRYYGDYVKMF